MRLFILLMLTVLQEICFAGSTLGVGVHLHQASPERIKQQIDWAQQLGVTSIRMDVPWKMVEDENGKFSVPPSWDLIVDLAKEKGIECLFVLDYGHPRHGQNNKPISIENIEAYIKYSEFIVNYFKNRVQKFEIWNEWDLDVGGTQPGRAEDYINLVKNVYPILKKVNPNAVILIGAGSAIAYGDIFLKKNSIFNFGKSKFFQEILTSGVFNYSDGVSVHIYIYWLHGKFRTAQEGIDLLDAIRTSIKSEYAGKSIPIYVTEVGWPTTHKGSRVFSTRDEQAEYLVNFSKKALSYTDVDSIYIYELQDGNSQLGDLEGNFGLIDVQGEKKNSFHAISDFLKSK